MNLDNAVIDQGIMDVCIKSWATAGDAQISYWAKGLRPSAGIKMRNQRITKAIVGFIHLGPCMCIPGPHFMQYVEKKIPKYSKLKRSTLFCKEKSQGISYALEMAVHAVVEIYAWIEKFSWTTKRTQLSQQKVI